MVVPITEEELDSDKGEGWPVLDEPQEVTLHDNQQPSQEQQLEIPNEEGAEEDAVEEP
jgi:hypothetical protein